MWFYTVNNHLNFPSWLLYFFLPGFLEISLLSTTPFTLILGLVLTFRLRGRKLVHWNVCFFTLPSVSELLLNAVHLMSSMLVTVEWPQQNEKESPHGELISSWFEESTVLIILASIALQNLKSHKCHSIKNQENKN